MKFVIAAMLITVAMAQRFPSIGPGSLEPIGPSSQSGGAAPPPSGCAGALDLSTGCSQLVAFGGLF